VFGVIAVVEGSETNPDEIEVQFASIYHFLVDENGLTGRHNRAHSVRSRPH